MTCRWRWFIHPETAISINRNGSIPLCVLKTHYRDRRAAVPNHRIFMQIQFSDHTALEEGFVGVYHFLWITIQTHGLQAFANESCVASRGSMS